MRLQRHVVLALHALERHAQMQFAASVEHGLVQRWDVLEPQTRILREQLMQSIGDLLLIAMARGGDGDALHRRDRLGRLQVVVILIVRIMHDRIDVQLIDLGQTRKYRPKSHS